MDRACLRPSVVAKHLYRQRRSQVKRLITPRGPVGPPAPPPISSRPSTHPPSCRINNDDVDNGALHCTLRPRCPSHDARRRTRRSKIQHLSIEKCQSEIFNVARIAELFTIYEVHEGAVESRNYVRKRLTEKERFKTLTEDGQRRGRLDVRRQ